METYTIEMVSHGEYITVKTWGDVLEFVKHWDVKLIRVYHDDVLVYIIRVAAKSNA